jgi:hypothetical protein
MPTIISLGSSCDAANNLKKFALQQENFFFDFLWNELDGLHAVSNIIENDFKGFDNIFFYEKTRKHPVLTWDEFIVNRLYPTVAFMHHNVFQKGILDSIIRKIQRTKEVLALPHHKTFFYYRKYDDKTPIDTDALVKETEEFCALYDRKYGTPYTIISCLMVEPGTDVEIPFYPTKNPNIIYSYLYSHDVIDKTRNEYSVKRWKEVLDTQIQTLSNHNIS